jgi:hypothetical protein
MESSNEGDQGKVRSERAVPGGPPFIIRIQGAPFVSIPYRVWRLSEREWMIQNLYNNERYGIDSTSRRCDCGDFEWRREGIDIGGCKHVKAIREWLKRH